MSSIIVLDSSDEEPEAENKELNLTKSLNQSSTSKVSSISASEIKARSSENRKPVQISLKRKSNYPQKTHTEKSDIHKSIKDSNTQQSPRNSPITVIQNITSRKINSTPQSPHNLSSTTAQNDPSQKISSTTQSPRSSPSTITQNVTSQKISSNPQSPRNSPTNITANIVTQKIDLEPQNILKRKASDEAVSDEGKPQVKRVKPILISKGVNEKWFAAESPKIEDLDDPKTNGSSSISEKILNEEGLDEAKSSSGNRNMEDKEEGDSDSGENIGESEEESVNSTFATLLQACREADSSEDMNVLIKTKLLRYYHSVHPDFVNSKGFCKTVKAVTESIRSSPQLVYYNLKSVVEELKIRKKSKNTVISNEDVATTGSERKDRQVKRLSRALYILTKKIAKLEAADVDLDDDNSTYLKTERFKKRACEIYEKICDLTGESKHAHRLVKKPISFQGSPYPEFNRTLQSFVNRTNTFPDYFDVYRCLDHCNAQYGFGLRNDDIKKIAQDAFLKIGKLLQNRRKTDLYETVAHFTSTSTDPALSDPSLNVRLNENQKHHSKISSIIDRFAREQELAALENSKNKSKPGSNADSDEKLVQDEKTEDSVDNSKSKDDHVSEKLIENENLSANVEATKEGSNCASVASKKSTQSNTLSAVEEIVISDDDDS